MREQYLSRRGLIIGRGSLVNFQMFYSQLILFIIQPVARNYHYFITLLLLLS